MKKEQQKKNLLKKHNPKSGSQAKNDKSRKDYTNLVGLIIVMLLGIIIYSNSFNCSFQLDDFRNIVNNNKIHDISNVKAWYGFSPNRPVSVFTLVLNYHFNKLEVWGYHLVNLFIHLVNTCLVWWLTLLIFSSPALKDSSLVRHKKVLALITALLFVSHPLATQTVTYIVQRMASMAAMFYLLSLALYAKARLTDKRMISLILLYSGSVISFLLAMFSKENAFTLPFAILLFEIFFLRTKKFSVNFKDYRVILLIAAFLCLMIIFLFKFSFNIFRPITAPGHPEYALTPLNYLLTQFSVIVKYIQLLFFPVNLNLDYDFPVSYKFFTITTLGSFLILASLIVLAVYLFNKQRIISFGIFWFFLTLSVESSIIPISDVIFEHRTYLPSFGFFIILSSLTGILYLNKHKTLAICIWTIIAVSYSIMTYERNKAWRDEITMWNDIVEKSPGKARAIMSRGNAYMKLEQWNNAKDDFTKALIIDPKLVLALTNRGYTYRNLGQYDKAIADYTMAVGIDPDYKLSWSNRGYIYYIRKQWDKAVEDFSRAIRIDPEFSDAYLNRGSAYGNIGAWDKAIDDISIAIKLRPDHAKSYINRGSIYWGIKQYDKAIADYTMAIGLDQKALDAYSCRGAVYSELGQLDKTLTDYSAAIAINPRFKDAYFNRGITYEKLGKWDKAIADYTSALKIDPNYSVAYENREKAYKKMGNNKNNRQ